MMAAVLEDVRAGKLICPVSRKPLRFEGDKLTAGEKTYRLTANGVPIIVQDEAQAAEYVEQSRHMVADYREFEKPSLKRRIADLGIHDYRSKRADDAFYSIFDVAALTPTFLSVGGGPTRSDPRITNLNIGPFANVDIVGDAYNLPYADGSVDGLECQAVLEHLADPHRAVSEMYRVMRPGAKAFISTPFIQGYHGYPSHFQNYTVTGHEELFRRQGFRLLDSGVAVGPAYALTAMIAGFISTYSPRIIRTPARGAWFILKQFIKPLDIWLNKHPQAHVWASLTYVLVER